MALKDLTRECSDALKPFMHDILEKCLRAVNHPYMTAGNAVRFMYPVGKMLSLMPQEEMTEKLERVVTPYVKELEELLGKEPDAKNKARTIFLLKLFTTLFQSLVHVDKENENKAESLQTPRPVQPTLALFPRIFPIVRAVTRVSVRDPEVMEAVWNLLKQSVSTLKDDVRGHVHDILDLIMCSYPVVPHGGALELTHPLLTLFGKDAQFRPLFLAVYTKVSAVTLAHIQTTGNVSDHVDLVTVFFQMMTQVVKKDAKMFDPAGGIECAQLFLCAQFCLKLAEVSAVRCASYLLSQLISASGSNPYINSVILENGHQLVKQLILSISSVNGIHYADYFAEVLLALNKKHFNQLCQWMNGFVEEPDFPTKRVTKVQKQKFAELVLKERSNKRKLSAIVREFNITAQC